MPAPLLHSVGGWRTLVPGALLAASLAWPQLLLDPNLEWVNLLRQEAALLSAASFFVLSTVVTGDLARFGQTHPALSLSGIVLGSGLLLMAPASIFPALSAAHAWSVCIVLAVGFSAAAWCQGRPERARWLMLLIAGTVVWQLGLSLAQLARVDWTGVARAWDWRPWVDFWAEQRRFARDGLGAGTLGNVNYSAELLAIALPTLWGSVETWRSRRFALLLVLSGASLGVMAATASRTSAVGLLIGLGLVLFLPRWGILPRRTRRLALGLGAVSLVVSAPSAWAFAWHDPALSYRLNAWQGVAADAVSHVWLGRGLGSYKLLSTQVFLDRFGASPPGKTVEQTFLQVHNELLQIVFEGGLLLALLVALFVWALSRSVSRARATVPVFYPWLASVVVFALHAMVAFPLHIPLTTAVLALLCALPFAAQNEKAPVPGSLFARWLQPTFLPLFISLVVLGTVSAQMALWRGVSSYAQARFDEIEGRSPEAIEAYRSLGALPRAAWFAPHAAMRLLVACGRFQEACELYPTVVRHGVRMDAVYQRGWSALQLGRPDEARRMLERVHSYWGNNNELGSRAERALADMNRSRR